MSKKEAKNIAKMQENLQIDTDFIRVKFSATPKFFKQGVF